MTAQANRIFGHPQCYAWELGDCSTGISKEHYVSAVVLRGVSLGKPTVMGIGRLLHGNQQRALRLGGRVAWRLPWRADRPRPEPLLPTAWYVGREGDRSLVAKVLCEKHNAALSIFDGAGSTLFSGMDRIDSAAGRAGEQPETFVVNGDHLERWMLKMLCGGLYSGTMQVRGGSMKDVCPPGEWLNVLFRGAVPCRLGRGFTCGPERRARYSRRSRPF